MQREPGMHGPGTTIVAYVDILGYKNLTEKIINNAQEVGKLERLLHTLTIGTKEKLKTDGAGAIEMQYQDLFLKVLETFSVRVVSDSIVFSMWVSGINADTPAGKNRALGYCLETMFTVMSYSFRPLLPRRAMCSGVEFLSVRITSQSGRNISSFFLSPAETRKSSSKKMPNMQECSRTLRS